MSEPFCEAYVAYAPPFEIDVPQMNKLVFSWLLASLLVAGCTRETHDGLGRFVRVVPGAGVVDLLDVTNSADCVLVPGKGIEGLAELDMAVNDLGRRIRGLELETFYPSRDTDPPVCTLRIPSLGLVSANRALGETKLKSFIVLVDTSHWSDFHPDSPLSRFCGRMPCGLSFADVGNVTRGDVIHHFGEPSNVVVPNRTSQDPLVTARTMRTLIARGETISYRDGFDEDLVYPQEGVIFGLRSNTVDSVTIREKIEQEPERDK